MDLGNDEVTSKGKSVATLEAAVERIQLSANDIIATSFSNRALTNDKDTQQLAALKKDLQHQEVSMKKAAC
eukprot:8068762-Pyramimonas_sp.AAC.1